MNHDYEEARAAVAAAPAAETQFERITGVATVAMTPFSVIAATCMQVILSSTSPGEDPALCFSLISASVISTAGMLMAIFLVITTSCNPTTSSKLPQDQPRGARFLASVKNLLMDDHYEQPLCDAQEQVRISRMMLRCLWFSLSFMVTGLLGRSLRNQLKISNSGTVVVVALAVWFIFLWSSFGGPLPKFYPCFKVLGRLFTTAFPVILMAAYISLYFTQK